MNSALNASPVAAIRLSNGHIDFFLNRAQPVFLLKDPYDTGAYQLIGAKVASYAHWAKNLIELRPDIVFVDCHILTHPFLLNLIDIGLNVLKMLL